MLEPLASSTLLVQGLLLFSTVQIMEDYQMEGIEWSARDGLNSKQKTPASWLE